ncbi:MAG TPA: hypothetical protein VIC57_16120 [Candidatus Dormibacteraeota bacterium]|jgi:DNA-binding response OmpR family regulator
MTTEPVSWPDIWERRRLRCLLQEELRGLSIDLPDVVHAILGEVRALAAVADPAVHARADVATLIERVNALDGPLPLLLHGPVCNALSMLKCAAQEILAGRAAPPVGRIPARPAPPVVRRLDWFLVVAGDGAELERLAVECAAALARPLPVRTARTLEDATERLARRDGTGMVIVNLTLDSSAGLGAHGLRVAAEAHRRRHAVLLVTAAGDYLNYWTRLDEAGLTGHDVVVKTRQDFAHRLRSRIREIAEPAPLAMSYAEDTGHVVWIGDVEVSRLEAQEALVLRVLDGTWQTPAAIADAGRADTELAPNVSAVPPLIATLRNKLADALVAAESASGRGQLIETRRRDGLPAQYRLAPWLRWQRLDDAQEPAGAAPGPPRVLVIEDDPDWAAWVVGRLGAVEWPVEVADSAEAAERALAGAGELPILVADLALRDAATGLPDREVGVRLIEGLAATRHGVRVVVLSAFGASDSLRARLFEAGVRTVDVIDKSAGRDDCWALLLASLQRAADELWRGVRRARESVPGHRVVRRERRCLVVDGHPVPLSRGQAAVVEELIRRPNQAVRTELLEACCFADGGRAAVDRDHNPLNKVHLTISRLRRRIDGAVGHAGVGESVIRTPHRGAVSAYELHGLVIDQVAL